MSFISIRRLKFYTKETLKYFNVALLSFGFIFAIILIKYKPMYEVKISGQEVGCVQDKNALNKEIEENIEEYSGENIEKVELNQKPEYELKLVERTKESQEDEVLIAIQKELEITYKYYEIATNSEVIERVNSIEEAEQISNEIKELTDEEVVLSINEKTTTNIQEITTNTLEVAKNNIIEKLDIDTSEEIANVNGVKIATLPVTGTITSRYAESSSIRSSKHTGLDIAAPKGTEIKAVAKGTVIYAQRDGSYGNLVKIDHGNGVETWYAHTSKMLVTVGQEVKAGDVIALVGSTGNSTGPHLHLEIRINGEHVNPQKYLYNTNK